MADTDVLVVGGGLGGVAAALAAAKAGASVILIESSQWLGGQMTGQGVCTPDEDGLNDLPHIPEVGSTRSYQEFKTWVRKDYVAQGMNGSAKNAPGNNWTSDDGFGVEAVKGHKIFENWLQDAGVTVRLGLSPTSATLNGRQAESISFSDGSTVSGTYILDATETGDLSFLLGLTYSIGAEKSGFKNETSGQPTTEPTWVQPITIPFAIEYRPGNTTPTLTEKPVGYDSTGFGMVDGQISTLQKAYTGFLTYRRVISHSFFPDAAFRYDISLVNVGSNDYNDAIYPSSDPENFEADNRATIAAAKRRSLFYLYYLQHEAPRFAPDQGVGYPEFVPRDDFFGADGYMAPLPYVREARRIDALRYVVRDDIIGPDMGPRTHRAKLFPDSCGLGNYFMDVHSNHSDNCYLPTNPFQIRVSQLVPNACDNLLAAGKCLGTTHITNGAFRLHPQEWNIGEAAGALAAYCIQNTVTPATVANGEDSNLARFQWALLKQGVPLYWWTDVLPTRQEWAAIHLMGVLGYFSGGIGSLDFQPDEPIGEALGDLLSDLAQSTDNVPDVTQTSTRAAVAQAFAGALGFA